MWPIGHASVAYLLYTALVRQRFERGPEPVAALLVGFGGIAPDLLDKPLAWYLGVIPTGRSMFHSLLVLVPIVLAVYLFARSRGRGEYGVAFGVGVLSHPLVDAAPALVSGDAANYLVWPLLPVTIEGPSPTVIGLLRSSLGDPYFLFEFFLLVVALAVWRADGYPGLGLFFPWALSGE